MGTRIASSATEAPCSWPIKQFSFRSRDFTSSSPLPIQNRGYDVDDVNVVRIESNHARNVVTDVFDLNVTARAIAHLRAHEETLQTAHVHNLVTIGICKFRQRNYWNDEHSPVGNSAMIICGR